jgi:hypothetical protein
MAKQQTGHSVWFYIIIFFLTVLIIVSALYLLKTYSPETFNKGKDFLSYMASGGGNETGIDLTNATMDEQGNILVNQTIVYDYTTIQNITERKGSWLTYLFGIIMVLSLLGNVALVLLYYTKEGIGGDRYKSLPYCEKIVKAELRRLGYRFYEVYRRVEVYDFIGEHQRCTFLYPRELQTSSADFDLLRRDQLVGMDISMRNPKDKQVGPFHKTVMEWERWINDRSKGKIGEMLDPSKPYKDLEMLFPDKEALQEGMTTGAAQELGKRVVQ